MKRQTHKPNERIGQEAKSLASVGVAHCARPQRGRTAGEKRKSAEHHRVGVQRAETPGHPEDLKLALRVGQKEPRACQHMYDAYASGILRRLHRLTGNEQDAEDGLQQVFLEAFRSIGNYRGEGPLGAWLNRITTHTAMDILKKRNRWRAMIEGAWPKAQLAQQEVPALPDRVFEREEVRELIWRLVQKLSPHKRMAVMICDLEGTSMEDAAAQLDIPHGTFISRLYHGRRELRRLFERESQRQGLHPGEWFDG